MGHGTRCGQLSAFKVQPARENPLGRDEVFIYGLPGDHSCIDIDFFFDELPFRSPFRPTMTRSGNTVAGKSTPQCFCRGEIPNLAKPLDQNHLALDDVLKAASQSIDFWPRLKGCQACLKSRLEELLETFEKVVGVFQTRADLFQITGRALSDPGRTTTSPPSLDLSYSSSHLPGNLPQTMPGSQEVPPMFLGDLRLDNQQSATVLRVLCHSNPNQFASILYEMRRVDCSLDMRLENCIGDLLYKVLRLMEPSGSVT